MICEHLIPLEKELIAAVIKETFRGKAWSDNCREWVYYDCVFTNLEKTIERFHFDRSIIKIHSHLGTHDGHEHGLECAHCKDAIMGKHPKMVEMSFSNVTAFE